MRIIAVTVLTALTAAACSGGSVTEDLEGNWEVASIADESGALSAPLDETLLTATISGKSISGASGCNRYRGDASIDGPDVSFGPLASTRRACLEPARVMSQENSYLTLLQNTDTWAGTSDGVNLLVDGETVIRFVAIDTNLDGTAWEVTAVSNRDGGIQSTLPGATPLLVFEDESTVSGTTGCNSFSGGYSTDEGAIDFGGLAVTEMFCEDIDIQEASFLSALNQATTFTTDGQTLNLFDANGSMLLTARSVGAENG